MIGYLTLILGLTAVVAIVWAGVWYARRREHEKPATTNAGDSLQRVAEMLGLDEVRESRLFQARILTVWGEINEFRIDCELWEQVQHPFYRVTIGFPKPLSCGIRISRDSQGGLLHRVMDAENETAPNEILVESDHDMDELRAFLQDDLRKPLEHLAARVGRMQMGDEYLHLYVENAPDGAFCESILRESLSVAKRVFGRAVELGPSKKTKTTSSYGQAKSEMSRRAIEAVDVEERPEEARSTRRVTLASMAAVSSEMADVEDGDREQAASIWAKKQTEAQSTEAGVELEVGVVIEVDEEKPEVEQVSVEQGGAGLEPKRVAALTLPGVGTMDIK